MISPAFTCSLGCCGGVLVVGVVEYENVGLPEDQKKSMLHSLNIDVMKINHTRVQFERHE